MLGLRVGREVSLHDHQGAATARVPASTEGELVPGSGFADLEQADRQTDAAVHRRGQFAKPPDRFLYLDLSYVPSESATHSAYHCSSIQWQLSVHFFCPPALVPFGHPRV